MIQFKPGTRVRLKEESRYSPAPSNPKIGSIFACLGTVTKANDVGSVYVSWDNHTSNGYTSKDLIAAEGCLDIWMEKWA